MIITSENAASLGQKGGIASGLARNEAKRRIMEEVALTNLAATYEGKTLARVRTQLDKLFETFLAEVERASPDCAKLDRLASAQARLNEMERQLAGRPMPGSLKPSAKPKASVADDMPQPIVSAPDAAQ